MNDFEKLSTYLTETYYAIPVNKKMCYEIGEREFTLKDSRFSILMFIDEVLMANPVDDRNAPIIDKILINPVDNERFVIKFQTVNKTMANSEDKSSATEKLKNLLGLLSGATKHNAGGLGFIPMSDGECDLADLTVLTKAFDLITNLERHFQSGSASASKPFVDKIIEKYVTPYFEE